MGPLGLVPRSFGFAFFSRIGLDENRSPGKSFFEFGQGNPQRLGDARRIDESVSGTRFEQYRRAIVIELEHGGQLLDRPALQSANDRMAAHPDLVECWLDLVKRQCAGIGER